MQEAEPFPNQTLLDQRDLETLLKMDRTTLYDFLQEPNTGFPRPRMAGRTKGGRPRLRWDKWEVLRWVTRMPEAPVEEKTTKRKGGTDG